MRVVVVHQRKPAQTCDGRLARLVRSCSAAAMPIAPQKPVAGLGANRATAGSGPLPSHGELWVWTIICCGLLPAPRSGVNAAQSRPVV
jgi:hypothetical protein